MKKLLIPPSGPERNPITIRLDNSEYDEVAAIAQKLDRSIAYIVKLCLQAHLPYLKPSKDKN